MPNATGNVDAVDYVNRRIYLSSASVDKTIDTLDIYKEVRRLRVITLAHRNFKPIIIAGGNIPKIPGSTFTPAYVQLLHGCRLVPYNSTHKLRIVRDTFTDDGLVGRDCFDRSSLDTASQVDIDIDFPEIEIRATNIDSAIIVLTALVNAKPTAGDIVAAMWSHMQNNGSTTGDNLVAAKLAAENAFAISASL